MQNKNNIPNVVAEGKKSANVPNLRFACFGDQWDYLRVSDLLETYSTNSLSWEMLEYNDHSIDSIFNVHYGLIHSGLPTQIDCNKVNLPYIKQDFVPKNYVLCKEGDVAFADASEDTEEVAKVIEFSNCNGLQIVCGLHTIHARDTRHKTVDGYKGFAFSSIPFHYQVRRIAQGTKVYSISAKNFSELFIGVPSRAEQRKIADFLTLIDDRIETQSKIIEKLQSQMKGICDKIFKQNRTVKLADCVECHASTLIESYIENLPIGSYPVYGAIGVIKYVDKYEIAEDAILILKDGASAGKVQYAKEKHSVIGTSNFLTPKKDVILPFIYFALLSFNFDKYRVGSGIPHIYFKDYKEEKIYYPTLKEQKQIVALLSSIEKKIAIELSLLEKLREQKKYLLSNMFI